PLQSRFQQISRVVVILLKEKPFSSYIEYMLVAGIALQQIVHGGAGRQNDALPKARHPANQKPLIPRGTRDTPAAFGRGVWVRSRAAREVVAYAKGQWGSGSVARGAWSGVASYVAFSYLSQASSRDLRVSSDFVESGMAPKGCCRIGATGDG